MTTQPSQPSRQMEQSPTNNNSIPDRSSFHTLDTIKHIWRGLDLPEEALAPLHLPTTSPIYPSSFKIDHLAQSTIALSALSAALVRSLHTKALIPRVTVPQKHACLEFKTERFYSLDGKLPTATWGPIGGLHRADDGYVRIHDTFPHHRFGTLELLGLGREASREDVAEKVRAWKRFELEDAAAKSGLAVYALRSYGEWDATPQADAVPNFPIRIRRIGDGGASGLPPHMTANTRGPERCLRGVRVLEFSRVIAAPVAGKTLAAHGADVIWITSPNLPDLPDLDRNLSRGKRTVQLDLDTETDCATLRALVKDADVFLQGYRPSSLAAKGFSAEALTKTKPGIIIANLSAFGPEGPWAERRGFDSLVQTCTGMNVSEAQHFGGDGGVAKPMPCQALDHAAGYLLATGIAAAVYRRAREGGSWAVDVSLAGVMGYLRSLGQWEGREGFEGVGGLPEVEDVEGQVWEERESGFGILRALKHAASVEGAEPGFEFMPKALGSDEARWL